MEKSKYLDIKQACELLSVSRPTFDKIRKKAKLKEFVFGKRPRFLREEIEKIADPKPISKIHPDARIDLDIFSMAAAIDLESEPNVFDLTRLRSFDPHGVLNLFCALVDRGRQGNKIKLIVEDNFICNHLRNLGFFNQLEIAVPGMLSWPREQLRTEHTDFKYPISLAKISMSKQEVPVVEKLLELLRKQGFSDTIGGYIAWIFGELTDNANTHLRFGGQNDVGAGCYLLAQRYRFSGKSDNECLIIAVADIGPGIHTTIKRNPKYQDLSDKQAFLSAFNPGVSSWADEYDRGRGLTDIFAIALGNRSIFRAESGGHVFMADFKNNTWSLRFDERMPQGTRFSLIIIDHDFEMRSRAEVKRYVADLLSKI
ncbi:MAG: helix-turn-helix domain-containing protein [Elusimicrobiota bacterium]